MSRRALPLLALAALLHGCGEAEVPAHLRIAGGDPGRGQALIYSYGCGTCHQIEGIRGARGNVGPAIDRYAGRSLVAGIMPNSPANLIAWLRDPPAIEPRTGMPNLGITQAQARDIASYLYTLGSESAAVYPPNPPLDLEGRGQRALYPISWGVQGEGDAGQPR